MITDFLSVTSGDPTLSQMLDPKGIYCSMTHNQTLTITVNNPNVWDSNCVLIPASEYEKKKKDRKVFMIEAYMKVYVYTL